MRNEETPKQHEQRVTWLALGVKEGLYQPTGEDIAGAMLSHQRKYTADEVTQYLREFQDEAYADLPTSVSRRAVVCSAEEQSLRYLGQSNAVSGSFEARQRADARLLWRGVIAMGGLVVGLVGIALWGYSLWAAR